MKDTWLQNLVTKAIRICRLNKEAAGNHRQDMTRPILQDLMNDGYTTVQWDSGHSRHSKCLDLNRQQWTIEDFISNLNHDAPMFEKSHPGDESCTIIVSGDGVSDVRVDSYGDVDSNIGISRPVKTPTIPEVKVKTLAPKNNPTIVEKPVEPKKKIVYVPKEEVHKQVDPFKRPEISDEDLEDWIKGLNKENIEFAKEPEGPTDEEREEWARNLERETSKKIPQWITSLLRSK